ncbi:MAG: DUF3071 domain-containing protein [Bifidobacteriaceae bacterium]|jgi:hypothetical protein|nr:DUF3071 domain-containing protein [Bifidobacteriaceae bacterium]
MNELTYLRVEDGRLICSDGQGSEFALPVTDQLRQAVREQTAAEIPDVVIQIPEVLRPKDIQALVRAGATAEELAAASGLDLEHVNRYAAPVMDERAFVAERARSMAPAHDPAAPTLATLAEARLEQRGVDAASLVWDAVRQAQGWVVRLDFESSEGPARARWRVDLASAALAPLDEQARWIVASPEPDSPIPPMRLLNPLPGGAEEADADPADSPFSLLDGLMEARGLRDPADSGSLEELSGRADVLELRRGQDAATEAVSYLEAEPLDSTGNPITFLQEADQAEPAPLPEPVMPPAPLPTHQPAWLAPAGPAADQPGAAAQADKYDGDEDYEDYRDYGDMDDAVRPGSAMAEVTEVVAQQPVRPDPVWDRLAERPATALEPLTDRASIWARTAQDDGFEAQGALFQAAPVEQADSLSSPAPPPPPAPALAPAPAGGPPVESAPAAPALAGQPAEDGEAQPEPPVARSRSGAKRSSVPSWDEIVFGAARTDS